jgi:hypothetical protein
MHERLQSHYICLVVDKYVINHLKIIRYKYSIHIKYEI